MPDKYIPFVRGLSRVSLYAAMTCLIFGLMYVDATTTGTFGETSLVEISQSILLFAISAIFVLAAIKVAALRKSAWLLATFSTASLIRENDIWLDMLHSDGWQILVTPVILVGLAYTWINRDAFLEEQKVYTESVSFGLLISALMTTYIFARLYGMGAFWQIVLQEAYARPVKDMSEECVELFGYGLLLFSALEFVALAKSRARELSPSLAPV